MPAPKPMCFFVMPFTAEMHYFYLYIRRHVEERHNLVCERADDSVAPLPISEKIRGMILKADVIIADCTGKNPNVYYELGLAHGLDRKVILITRDPIDSIPTDLRLFEFIKYDPAEHVGFLDKLDKALNKIFEERYDAQFETAEKYFQQLAASCPTAKRSTREEFASRYRALDASGDPITPTHLLSLIVQNNSLPDVMEKIIAFEVTKEDPVAAAEALTSKDPESAERTGIKKLPIPQSNQQKNTTT